MTGTDARVAIVRCRTYDRAEVGDAVARAVELIGGTARFLPPGSPLPLREREAIRNNILLKPNLLLPRSREDRVCTDPEVVLAAAGVFRAAGAGRIAVGDSPGFGSGAAVMRRCGLENALPPWVERLEFSESRRHPVPGNPSLELAVAALDAGVLVNLPKLKTHAYMGLTVAVKNLFGCVTGTQKAQWHLRAGENPGLFARLLVEIAYSFPPGLVMVDGVVGMEGNGPGSGDPRPLGLILAGDDPTAVDAVAARIVGFPEEAVPTLAAARAAGRGQPDISKIEVLGERIEDVAVKNFRPAAADTGIGVGIPRVLRGVLRGALTSRPVVDAGLCKLCGRCAEVCPPKAIVMDVASKVYPQIDGARCIRCFCCQEMCPHRAISVRKGWLRRWGILRDR